MKFGPQWATLNQIRMKIKVQEIGRRWLDEVEAVCTLQLNPPDLSVAKGSFLCILEKNPCRSSEQKSQSQGSSTIANLAKTKIDLLKVQIQLHWFWLWLWKFVLLVLRNKKTGSRRRNVNKEDLVAEDKPRLVSSLGPSCRCMEHRRGRGKWLKWSDVSLVRSLVLWLAI